MKLIEEETAKRVEEAIQKKVEESLNSEEIKQEIQKRLEDGRRRLNAEVAAQLEKEKEAALLEARQKEVNIQDKSPVNAHLLVFGSISLSYTMRNVHLIFDTLWCELQKMCQMG